MQIQLRTMTKAEQISRFASFYGFRLDYTMDDLRYRELGSEIWTLRDMRSQKILGIFNDVEVVRLALTGIICDSIT